jgi:Heterokaryon incompatibility protein (HET)
MRLLKVLPNGEVGLTQDFCDNAIPSYVIVSHVWGAGLDSEEVTFQDMVEGTGRDKAGFKKIQFCRNQVVKDGFKYFWMDTACINKSSSTELQESINSMFRWYQNSARCYVYLSDVSTKKRKRGDENSPLAWEQAFRTSKWFTRGWTLQELIASKQVEFFDRGGTSLGTKTSLKDIISSITRIPTDVLVGQNFKRCSIAQRMSWAAFRETTRAEDLAYCLMGLFDVNMPLLYGEGEKAFHRLQEEIIKNSDDQSIFAWKDEKRYAVHGLLARSPAAFADSYDIVPIRSPGPTSPFTLTQLGLRIQLQLAQDTRSSLHTALLNCMDRTTGDRIGVHLISLGENRFLRTKLDQFARTQHKRMVSVLTPFEARTIYVPQLRLSPIQSLRTFKPRGRCGANAANLYPARAKRGNAGSIVKTMCGMCLRCPARRSSLLPNCRIGFALPFG